MYRAKLGRLCSCQHWILYWAESVPRDGGGQETTWLSTMRYAEKHDLRSQLPLDAEAMWVATRGQNALLEECCWFIECFWLCFCKIFKKPLEFPGTLENKESTERFGAAEKVHHIRQTSTPTGILAVGLDGSPRAEQTNQSEVLPLTPSRGSEPTWSSESGSSHWHCCSGCFWTAQSPGLLNPCFWSSNVSSWRGSSFCTGFSDGNSLHLS